ncbi:NAD(P)-dependent oxidoreductase [Halioxenophilus aromaticivorans]|uniref:NAD(P)-dependent oxidoreductase n=1 Tax=Halioxenophilus aromaticivorans TaxID=1306992 RepID=A0AAV3TXV6_9ALTE
MARWGFIGLGSQGGPMAQRMIETDNEVWLWARRAESLALYKNTDACFATTIKQLGQAVEHCGVCVVDDAGVDEVCRQLIPAMKPGSSIAIHSTVNPMLCQHLAEQAKEQGVLLVDAPVSGGGEAAADGTLTVMMGGEQAAVDLVTPVLRCFAGLVVHLGEVGSGQLAKLVNNNLMAANLALANHALSVAEALNLKQEAFSNLVKVSSGRSFAFDVRARMPNPQAFHHGAQLLAKDVRLLATAAGDNADYQAIKQTADAFLEQALQQ